MKEQCSTVKTTIIRAVGDRVLIVKVCGTDTVIRLNDLFNWNVVLIMVVTKCVAFYL